MRRNLFTGSVVGISLLFIAADVYDITSAGAPIASTGSPGESTCARSGCHTGSTVNSGTGFLNIDFNNGLTAYEPGKKYTVTVSLQQQDIYRFGFEMLALHTSDSTNAGAFIILDTKRTQILEGLNEYLGRKYVTYKYPGTLPYASNLGKWTFEWEAPAVAKGAITFYTSAVSANNDGTDKGDTVYIKELTVVPALSGINEEMNLNAAYAFPNPSDGRFEISNGNAKITALEVYTVKGEKVYSGYKPDSSVLDLDLPDGVYFLQLHSGSHTASEKIIIVR